MRGIPFTAEEDEVFRRLYPTGGPRAVHEALPHRSLDTLMVRAHRLGIKSAITRGQPKRFGDDYVIEVLAECRYLYDEAAARIGCHVTTVYKAHKRQHLARGASR